MIDIYYRKKRKLSALITGTILITGSVWIGACKNDIRDINKTNKFFPPLYTDRPYTTPDSLQYFYNSLDARGKALSGGEFSVFLKYPVLRSESRNLSKLVDWLDDEVFILAHNGREDNATIRNMFKADYPSYANYTLNSWLATEETTKMGCIQESLAVEVVMNSEIITMKVHHTGYWGGANGDDMVRYTMFDKDYNRVDVRSVIENDKIAEFNRLLIAEYEKNIDPWRDYDTNYKLNPDYMALIQEGLIVIYPGYAHAEGQPTMYVSLNKFIHMLKPQYRKMYNS